IGLALAYWMVQALVALAPRQGGRALVLDVSPDWRVLAFTLGVSILVGVVFGIAPALQSTRLNQTPALKAASSMRVPGRFALTKLLVVLQIGVSLVLLIGAGLFLRSLNNLKSVDPGFDAQRLVMLSVNPSRSGYQAAASWSFFDALVERAQATPGVI